MGAELAANMDAELYWSSEGRSMETVRRAEVSSFTDLGTLTSLAETADVVVSVCPPHAAWDVASALAETTFSGLFVDANAVAPATARRIGALFARFVDGGIVGGPPPRRALPVSEKTRLYVSGDEVGIVASLFAGSNVDVRVVAGGPGAASAVKVAFAGWTKGSSALLLGIAAYARSQDVLVDLLAEWEASIPELPGRLDELASRLGPKAWRFVGEMDEIARAQEDVGLPGGFHAAAAEIFERLAGLKDSQSSPTPDELLALIERPGPTSGAEDQDFLG